MKDAFAILWFKKDLRITDNTAFNEVIQSGLPILPVFLFEEEYLQHPTTDIRHIRFAYESCLELKSSLKDLGLELQILKVSALVFFTEIVKSGRLKAVFSCQETGLQWSFDRDKAIGKLLRANRIPWHEAENPGIIRGLKTRDSWLNLWQETILKALIIPPEKPLKPAQLNVAFEQFELSKSILTHKMQKGGEKNAHKYLSGFIGGRGKGYMKFISKPEESRWHGGRISPYLSWGNISVRQVYHITRKAIEKGSIPKKDGTAFLTRVRWRNHFIQKFESECSMEFEPVNKGFANFYPSPDLKLIEAWRTGHTGWPLVDAAMRCLIETGFINFRMRAMLVSVLTHTLNQNWTFAATHLAKQFLDFEPGIHYPQIQMQAGVVGTHIVRSYNPFKQALDHDPKGDFIKKWVPELSKLPAPFVLDPTLLTSLESQMYGFELGIDYPKPICDFFTENKKNSQRLWAMRKTPLVKSECVRILKVHSMPDREAMARLSD